MMLLEAIRRRRSDEVAAAQAAFKRSGKTKDSFLTLSLAYRNAGLWTANVNILRKAVASFPNDADLWLLLGGAYTAAEQPVTAEAAFQRAIELMPQRPAPYHLLGINYYRRGLDERAYEVFGEALKLSSADVTALCGQGYVCKKLQRLEEALTRYKGALAVEPDNVLALCGIGDVYEALGRNQDMKRAYEMAARLSKAVLPHLKLYDKLLESGNGEQAEGQFRQIVQVLRRMNVPDKREPGA